VEPPAAVAATAGAASRPPARAPAVAIPAGVKPQAAARQISPPLFYALTVASIGGPLALIALEIPPALSGAGSSAGLVTLVGTLAFIFPLVVWLRYSVRIASSGGLYAFVEAAVGRPIARIQAGFWIISYFLYLVYTVPFIVYDLLPAVFPGIGHIALPLDVALALVIAAIMLSPLLVTVGVLTAIAIAQVLIAIVLVIATFSVLGVPPSSFTGQGNFGAIALAAGRTAPLYICASLPLYLAAEVRDQGRTVQRALSWAFAGVGALAVVAVFPLAHVQQSIADATIPGVALIQTSGLRALAPVVGIGVVLSVAGLIFAEFLALTRLLGTIVHRPQTWVTVGTVAAFMLATLVSLVNPARAYDLLLKPSLIALWVSQLLVVTAYPWFVAKQRVVRLGDIGLAAAASLLMLFALYSTLTSGSGT
jgi:hypothetical protein